LRWSIIEQKVQTGNSWWCHEFMANWHICLVRNRNRNIVVIFVSIHCIAHSEVSFIMEFLKKLKMHAQEWKPGRSDTCVFWWRPFASTTHYYPTLKGIHHLLSLSFLVSLLCSKYSYTDTYKTYKTCIITVKKSIK